MKSVLSFAVLLVVLCGNGAQAGLFGPAGDDTAEKQAAVRTQRDEMLAEMYTSNPDLRGSVSNAAGYATFKTMNINLLVVATANGYGVLVNNKTGEETFMRMASLGGGLGAGVKDMRVMFVFHSSQVMEQFIEKGWQFGGQADAAAKYKESGVSAEQGAKANVGDGKGITGGTSGTFSAGVGEGTQDSVSNASKGAMEIYQFTESGLALQATISGTKYWKDGKLNPQ